MRRYVRHSKHSKHSRALALAQNMKRRAAPVVEVVKAPEPAPVVRIVQEPGQKPKPQPKTEGRYIGYHIEAKRGGWFVLLDPDGNQVGKASRDPKELEAMIPGED